jgi:hypothetical protein
VKSEVVKWEMGSGSSKKWKSEVEVQWKSGDKANWLQIRRAGVHSTLQILHISRTHRYFIVINDGMLSALSSMPKSLLNAPLNSPSRSAVLRHVAVQT